MTKKQKKIRKPAKANQDKQAHLPIRVTFDKIEDVERIYSNHVRVSLTPLDATLDFCDLGPLTEENVEKHDDYILAKVKPKVRIVLSHDVLLKLDDAIKTMMKEQPPLFGATDADD